ncbi:hypothetical protein G6027_16555 [Dietzia sp. SLG310A2-38A2]|uniref:hypothetical protein n=1 Tax=Dietzia sp. SLG310A2-38A2 TaxID=1630643 RepID=UPI0015F91A05|nr:hypothetical protein [Dietzia sp. SLG310A2-38A2]MBB1032458.1 hypothetical protein [Dietzia sp. SLG310A2-38A2]
MKKLWFFGFGRGRAAAPATPTTAEPDQASYDRAWADYVEWSGLDEERLPEARREE